MLTHTSFIHSSGNDHTAVLASVYSTSASVSALRSISCGEKSQAATAVTTQRFRGSQLGCRGQERRDPLPEMPG